MPALLVIALVVVPLLELVAIIQVGQVIGTTWTITLLVADSLLGAWLLRREGRRAWAQFRKALAEGRWPGDEVTQGALVIVGGALLLTPGFLTDVVGFLFLLAPTRILVSRLIRARVRPTGLRTGERGTGRGPEKGGDALGIEVVEIERDEPHERPDDDSDPPRASS